MWTSQLAGPEGRLLITTRPGPHSVFPVLRTLLLQGTYLLSPVAAHPHHVSGYKGSLGVPAFLYRAKDVAHSELAAMWVRALDRKTDGNSKDQSSAVMTRLKGKMEKPHPGHDAGGTQGCWTLTMAWAMTARSSRLLPSRPM
jgi:hypothetical protein